MDKFWSTLLKVTPFMKIDDKEKMRKFEAGLQPTFRKSMKVYPHDTLQRMMESAMIAEDLHSPGMQRKQEFSTYRAKQKTLYKNHSGNGGSKRPHQDTFSKKPEGSKKGKFLSPAQVKEYLEEGRCFACGERGHRKQDCPKHAKPAPPSSHSVPDVQANTHEEKGKRQLLKGWGSLDSQRVLILFDPGSTDNFISLETADRLNIPSGRLGVPINSSSAFEGLTTTATPILGKMNLRMSAYKDRESFLLAPIEGCDVILGMPWHFRTHPIPDYVEKTMTFTHEGKEHKIPADAGDWAVPIVSHISVKKELKNSVSAYLIFARERKESSNSQPLLSHDENVKHKFLEKYEDCFTDELPDKLPPERLEDHRIELIPGSSPPNQPPYRVSLSQQEEIMKQVNELMEKGLIRPSTSPYCSPVLLVQKKDGTFRMCIDYRSLNKITIKNRFPIPRIDDILDKLQGASIFSRIDLKSGYHQIRIAPEDVHKTAFRTTFGLYEFLVMPFGLTNAPATFNRMMDRIFSPHRKFTGVFFDDILIFSHSEEEHREHLEKVFSELRKHKLQINAKKSEFFLREIHYLGHIVSHNQVRMDPAKVQAIQEWPTPTSVHDVRSFLGLCSYYRRFIRGFAHVASPLHDLTRKKVTFQWGRKQKAAFELLKYLLSHGLILIVPDLSKPFEVHCDASGDCVGAVLNQEGHAVAYESRRLKNAELHASIYEKELLAVVHALSIWKHYLLGADFLIRTDHQSLRHFLSQKKLSEKQMRWANFLSMFHFQILHTSGSQNLVADALSRIPKVNTVTTAYHQELESLPEMYPDDPDFATIWKDLQNGNSISPFSIKDGYMYHDQAICVAEPLRKKVMDEAHASPYAGHRGIAPTMAALERYFFWPTLRSDIERYVRECLVCQKVKYDRHKSYGFLQPLPIPEVPWQSIAMDFVTGLPRTQAGNDAIWTIVDRFSKQAHFIPVRKTIKADHMARIFLAQIFKHHGMPRSIVSDRDPRMTSLFWKALFENLGTKLKFSSAYHPQTDGQSEVANATVLDLLKSYVADRQTDWERYLPLVEFAYNNTVHSTTGKAPFEIIYGKPLLPPILLTKDKIFAADTFVRDLDLAYSQVKKAIERSQAKHKKAADKHRRGLEIKKGDYVLLKFKRLD